MKLKAGSHSIALSPIFTQYFVFDNFNFAHVWKILQKKNFSKINMGIACIKPIFFFPV